MKKYYSKEDTLKIAEYFLKKLAPEGAYIYHEAVTTNSIYIKFKNEKLKSLTIRDHNTKKKYRYKWNFRVDLTGKKMEEDRGVKRYFYGIDSYLELVKHIRKYNNKLIEKRK